MDNKLSPNSLAFIALCNEYCMAVEQAARTSRTELITTLTKVLPRLYISAADLTAEIMDPDSSISPVLDEQTYEEVRSHLEQVFGADDTYLEVFHEDMKYSDTPIAATVSEGLADLFQVCYNFIETVRDAPEYLIEEALAAIKEDFGSYWSSLLCNVMRPLNQLRYSGAGDDGTDDDY